LFAFISIVKVLKWVYQLRYQGFYTVFMLHQQRPFSFGTFDE